MPGETTTEERLLAISRENYNRHTESLLQVIEALNKELTAFRETRELMEEFIAAQDSNSQKITKAAAALVKLHEEQRAARQV